MGSRQGGAAGSDSTSTSGRETAPVVAWPAVGFETAEWSVATEYGLSRRQAGLNRGTYNAAVIPAVRDAVLTLPSDVAADLSEATTALVRFDERADQMLGAESQLAPMHAVLLRTESASSSQIEGLTASARRLALAELGEDAGANAQLVIGNVRAMDAALRLAAEPGTASILTMHEALMRGQHLHTPGELRTQQVWIGGGAGPRTAAFVPPLSERVEGAMRDLDAFIQRDDIPPLAHAAIAHAQFETIHPFTDGNGRTGRALVHAMLRHSDVTTRVATPISAGLLTDPAGYFAALTKYRKGDARPILEVFSRSARQAASFGYSLTEALAEARREMRARAHARSHSAVWPLIDLAIGQPVLNTRTVVERLGVSEPVAGNALRALADAAVLRQVRAARRNRVWQCDAVLSILDGFGEQLRRARPGRTG